MTASAKGSAKGEDIDFEGGLTLLSDRAYVELRRDRVRSRPDHLRLRQVGLRTGAAAGQRPEENPADVTACQEAATGLKVGDFVDNPSNEGSADVDGTATTKISGDLNVGAAIDAMIKLTENPACSSQLEAAGPLPWSANSKRPRANSTTRGEESPRRGLRRRRQHHPQARGRTDDRTEGHQRRKGRSRIRPLARRRQRGTGRSPPRPAPSRCSGLFQKLGVNPIELLEGAQQRRGLGSLLEGVTGGGPPRGAARPPAAVLLGWLPARDGYRSCLEDAETPADLQQCASMIQ